MAPKLMKITTYFFINTPEHNVLMVSYFDPQPFVVGRRTLSVLGRQ
jgi:hypothetical protein